MINLNVECSENEYQNTNMECFKYRLWVILVLWDNHYMNKVLFSRA